VISGFIGNLVELKNLLRVWQALDTVFRIITNLSRDINGSWRLPNILQNSVVGSYVPRILCAAKLRPAALVAGPREAGASSPPTRVTLHYKYSCLFRK
jgi:hypothetical protein